MFRLHDGELTQAELQIYEDAAHVSKKDGYIMLASNVREAERGSFNACEILLEWSNPEHFGIQRIRLGATKPLTRAQWWRKLNKKDAKHTLLERVLYDRKTSVQNVFVGQKLRFRMLGWRAMTLDFWTPNNMVHVRAAPDARITRTLTKCSDASLSRFGEKIP